MHTFGFAARSLLSHFSCAEPALQPPTTNAHSLFNAIRCHRNASFGPVMSYE